MRVLGVDYGSVRTGLAVSDPFGVTCRPFGILTKRDEESLVSDILFTAKELNVEAIVVGIPRPLSGGTNRQLETVLGFVKHLQQVAENALGVHMVIRTWDERFTTSLARRHARLGQDDAVAACYMLQDYLDTLSRATGGE